MDSLTYNYNIEDSKSVYSDATDNLVASANDNFGVPDSLDENSGRKSIFSPLAPPFQSRVGNDLISLMSQQEPRPADTAPSTVEMEEVLSNLRLDSDLLFNDVNSNHSSGNYFLGNREPVAASNSNIWGENMNTSGSRNGEMIDTFDFLIKSLSSANNYVSMLTREQLSVLRSIRPSLLYDFLQEVAKVRSDRRMRRALPNECAFCKNNGENEESYSSHALKDWRGRVLCPVLRAFRCPRCAATGDRAHTIKYCPDNIDNGLERSGSLASRRRAGAGAGAGGPLSLGGGRPGGSAPATPVPSPSASAFANSPLWSTFGIN